VSCPAHGAAKAKGDTPGASTGDQTGDNQALVGYQGNKSMVSPVQVVGPDGRPIGANLTGAERTAQVGSQCDRSERLQATRSCTHCLVVSCWAGGMTPVCPELSPLTFLALLRTPEDKMRWHS
jgi:hypothetical protein